MFPQTPLWLSTSLINATRCYDEWRHGLRFSEVVDRVMHRPIDMTACSLVNWNIISDEQSWLNGKIALWRRFVTAEFSVRPIICLNTAAVRVYTN